MGHWRPGIYIFIEKSCMKTNDTTFLKLKSRNNRIDFHLQPRFRSMWERYCRGVNAIVYMVDAADHDKIEVRAF